MKKLFPSFIFALIPGHAASAQTGRRNIAQMKNHSWKRLFLAIAVVCDLSLTYGSRPAVAEEGGSGHYFPGSMSDFIDAVPPSPTFIVRYNQLYYSGSVGAKKAIPIAGFTTLGLSATSWGEGLSLLWRPPIKMGERWSYAMSATIPLVQMNVSASAVVGLPGRGPVSISRSGSLNALGDVILMPLMFNYNVNPNFNVNIRVGFYVPTGSYTVGHLANTGKNYFTTEPTLGLVYLGTKNGREASLFTGIDFNTENNATHYQSGTQFHLDGTLAQHLPLLKGLAGIGVTSFYYQQVTGDSGPGATFGDFESTSAGIGPVLSYIKPKSKTGHVDFMADLKWLNEYYTKNRLQGNTVFVKLVLKF